MAVSRVCDKKRSKEVSESWTESKDQEIRKRKHNKGSQNIMGQETKHSVKDLGNVNLKKVRLTNDVRY